jgi:cobalt-zinc-cadmium efflux system outer membrane protein
MFMAGYQNEGFNRYSYGEELMSAWMFSASQMFPFPGKLGLREALAAKDAENLFDMHEVTRLGVVTRVKELYYDLFMAYKDVDLIGGKKALVTQVEDAAAARYSSGKGSQQDVLIAQAEKYMLLEKEEMLRQKILSAEALLNATVGRDVSSPLGRPVEEAYRPYRATREDLLKAAAERSPEIKAKERLVAASEVKLRLAHKEYYPDFTVSAEYDNKGGPFLDMWALRTAVNIPLYYRTKQRQGVYEAEAVLTGARRDLEAARLEVAFAVTDDYGIVRTAEKLMEIYKDGLIPKTQQDFESVLAGYTSGGGIGAAAVIMQAKALLEYETLYWGQFVEREKAIARLDARVGVLDAGGR